MSAKPRQKKTSGRFASKAQESIPHRSSKSGELGYLLLLVTAVFLIFAIISYNPTRPTDAGGENQVVSSDLGKAGQYVAEWIVNFTFGRWCTLAIPLAFVLLVVGRWSRGRFRPTKWVVTILGAGFFGSFTIAFAAIWLGKDTSAFGLYSGVGPLFIAQIATANLGRAGTIIVAAALMLSGGILILNMKPMLVAGFVFYQVPVTVTRELWRIVKLLPFPRSFPRFSFFNRGGRKSSNGNAAGEYEYRNELETQEAVDPYQPKKGGNQKSGRSIHTGLDVTESRGKAWIHQRGDEPYSRSMPESSSRSGSDSSISTAGDPSRAKKSEKTPHKISHTGPVVSSSGKRKLPPLDLLNEPVERLTELDYKELEDNSRLLEDKLANLNISARVIKTNPGPVITRYDLQPAPDVKISRIANLTDDIKMALSAKGVRILAPIPGEPAIGIEVPNRSPETIYIRDVIDSDDFRNAKSPLTIALGKDTNGNIYCTDLARMPHLLIAGATGSGKSVCINVILTSLLYRSDPKNVRLVLIDPKKIELSLYSRLDGHHLATPPGIDEKVITRPGNALKTLRSVHLEMTRRYDILEEAGVRSLEEYNNWIKDTAPMGENETDLREHLPYLVVVIDEMADLMIMLKRDFEELVVRLAQMARAVGIHLIVATQRPSVDVITGIIKANFPARIAFFVPQKVDSRTIIDEIGADALLKRGDMLFKGPDATRPRRLHGAFISTKEVELVIEFVRGQPDENLSFQLPDPDKIQFETSSVDFGDRMDERDELFETAAKIVVKTEQGSVSVLQRRLRVGYARAARLIDQLEQAGIVGPFDGSKARMVLMTPEELRENFGIGETGEEM